MSEKKEEKGCFVWSAFIAAVITIPLTRWLAPDLIPLDMYDVWSFHETGLMDWLRAGIPIFLWGFGVTIFIEVIKDRSRYNPSNYFTQQQGSGEIFLGGLALSVWAGVAEEIAFRWLLFFSAFAYVSITNFLFFDFLGFGIPEAFHLWVWGPLANFTTLGYLENYLGLTPDTWLFGAAVLSSNMFFRDGHKYQGFIGWTNSWFLGMFFFWMMFTYGLLAAIVVHFTYDFIIFTTVAVAKFIEEQADARRRRRRWQENE